MLSIKILVAYYFSKSKMKLAIDFSCFCNSIFLVWVLLTHHAQSMTVERSPYIIHMDKSFMPRAFTNHHHWYTSIVSSLSQPGTTSDVSLSMAQLIYSYDNVLHGFSSLLSLEELERLKTSPGFVSAYIDREIKQRTTHTPKFLSLNPSSGIWPASNYGKDIIVGIVDSGVWPESHSFNDDGMTAIPPNWKGTCDGGQEFNASMCNLKLIGARYFNKGLIASSKLGFKPSMNSARDDYGHGTHTASTAVGNYVDDVSYFGYAKGTASGMAPRARLAVYKVFWREGFQSSDFLAGIDQAVADGVDVLSLSLGYDEDLPFYENTISIACFAAMEKGVVVSHAGGNTGPGLGSLFDSMPWSLTVGAGSVDRWFAGSVTLGNGLTITGWSSFPARVLVENLPLIYNRTLSSCNSTELLALAPYGIIICENVVDVVSQFNYVTSSSKIAAAIYISDDEIFSTELGDFAWPGAVISLKHGPTVINYAKTNESTASITFQETILGVKHAPYVASYSSRGPSRTYNGILKPDLLAPGSFVLAAWVPTSPVARIGLQINLASDYNIVSGTSMSCPHIAGVAALLKSVHPKWTPAMIRSAMMTTANPVDNTGNNILDQGNNFTFASPLVMGSGHVDPNRALDPGLVYDTTPQDYVNVLCYMNYTEKQLLTLTRSKHYNCLNSSPDLNYPSFIALYSNTSSTKLVQTFKRFLTNVGNGTANYHAEVIAPIGSHITVIPNILVFNHTYDKKSFTMTIEYESDKNEKVTYGSLVWVEDNQKHKVRSPIVISPEVKIRK